MTSQATNSQGDPLAGFGPNEWIVEDMYQRYLADPSSVDPAWHDFFADYRPAGEAGAATVTSDTSRAGGAAAPAPARPLSPTPDGATAAGAPASAPPAATAAAGTSAALAPARTIPSTPAGPA
ncbi:MAG TPA: hypothetical protein VF163_21835, partial [Micromonosporaceae bacterium]